MPRKESYTYGATPEEVIRASLPPKYEMVLTKRDMLTILRALGESGEDEAMSMRVDILTSIGIEEI